ncbi:hypothetical protein PLICRDRAFT_701550 [Plicaturopsis crispa FD-325 SS-3]|uniref:Uncharacterized protein n=1 Tax=Plicaturopsis crispa FD-325 SS-3 TaxID=944288 RepID=A0A0C9SRM4_PLICR|nr:hypothetical protein PLICRDRAFT_701550 [Plicaturopsis crispa FD-325 SS-3]
MSYSEFLTKLQTAPLAEWPYHLSLFVKDPQLWLDAAERTIALNTRLNNAIRDYHSPDSPEDLHRPPPRPLLQGLADALEEVRIWNHLVNTLEEMPLDEVREWAQAGFEWPHDVGVPSDYCTQVPRHYLTPAMILQNQQWLAQASQVPVSVDSAFTPTVTDKRTTSWTEFNDWDSEDASDCDLMEFSPEEALYTGEWVCPDSSSGTSNAGQ